MTDLEVLLGLDKLPQPGLIPVEKLFVRWDRAPGSDAVTRVRVMNRDDQPEGSVFDQSDSGGCCEMDWMTDSLGTPLGVFVQLLVTGFASREEMHAALHQFRNIHGQEVWATFLLELSGDPDIERILVEEAAEAATGRPAPKH
jgi:hypothetical protein